MRWGIVAAGALALGIMAGRAGAYVIGPGPAQTALALARPAVTAYTLPVVITPGDIVDTVGIGRDMTAPYAMLVVIFPNGFGPIPANTPQQFVYRPIWDVGLLPNVPNGGTTASFHAMWEASDIAARWFLTYRTAMNTPPVNPAAAIQIALDGSVLAGGALHSGEFFQYSMQF